MKISTYMLTYLELMHAGKVTGDGDIPLQTLWALSRRRVIWPRYKRPGYFITEHGSLLLAGARAQRRRHEDGDE